MLEFCRFWIRYSKICKTTARKASWWLCYHLLPRICFIVKVVFFLKNQLGIGVWWGKPGEMGQNWILEPLFSEIWVIMLDITNFSLTCTRSLDGRVVIAFRSNLPWFCEIWAVMGSIPPSGTWFFFSFKLIILMFLCMLIYQIMINRSQKFWVIYWK